MRWMASSVVASPVSSDMDPLRITPNRRGGSSWRNGEVFSDVGSHRRWIQVSFRRSKFAYIFNHPSFSLSLLSYSPNDLPGPIQSFLYSVITAMVFNYGKVSLTWSSVISLRVREISEAAWDGHVFPAHPTLWDPLLFQLTKSDSVTNPQGYGTVVKVGDPYRNLVNRKLHRQRLCLVQLRSTLNFFEDGYKICLRCQ